MMTRDDLRTEVQNRINKNLNRITEVIRLKKEAKELCDKEFNGELLDKIAYYDEEKERCESINILFSDYLNKVVNFELIRDVTKNEIKIFEEKLNYYLKKENSGFVLKREEVEDSDKCQKALNIDKSYLLNLEWLIKEHKLIS